MDGNKHLIGAGLRQYPPREELPPPQIAEGSDNLSTDPSSPVRDPSAPFDSSNFDNLSRDFEHKAHVGEVLVKENPDVPLFRDYDLSGNFVKDPYRIIDFKHKWEANPEMNERLWLTNSGERVHFGFKGEELISAKALALDYRPNQAQ